MFRAKNSTILRSYFWLYIHFLVQCTDTAADRCIVPKAVHTIKKSSWGWANLSPATCRDELNRLINEKVVASCWLLTSLYWWCTVTQTSRINRNCNVVCACERAEGCLRKLKEDMWIIYFEATNHLLTPSSTILQLWRSVTSWREREITYFSWSVLL